MKEKEKKSYPPPISDERFLKALEKLGGKATSIDIRKALKLGSYYSPAICDAGFRLKNKHKVTTVSVMVGKRRVLQYTLCAETSKFEVTQTAT